MPRSAAAGRIEFSWESRGNDNLGFNLTVSNPIEAAAKTAHGYEAILAVLKTRYGISDKIAITGLEKRFVTGGFEDFLRVLDAGRGVAELAGHHHQDEAAAPAREQLAKSGPLRVAQLDQPAGHQDPVLPVERRHVDALVAS